MSYRDDVDDADDLIPELESKVEELENELSLLSDKYSELLAFVSNFRLLSHSFTDELLADIDSTEEEIIIENTSDAIDGNNFKKD